MTGFKLYHLHQFVIVNYMNWIKKVKDYLECDLSTRCRSIDCAGQLHTFIVGNVN